MSDIENLKRKKSHQKVIGKGVREDQVSSGRLLGPETHFLKPARWSAGGPADGDIWHWWVCGVVRQMPHDRQMPMTDRCRWRTDAERERRTGVGREAAETDWIRAGAFLWAQLWCRWTRWPLRGSVGDPRELNPGRRAFSSFLSDGRVGRVELCLPRVAVWTFADYWTPPGRISTPPAFSSKAGSWTGELVVFLCCARAT